MFCLVTLKEYIPVLVVSLLLFGAFMVFFCKCVLPSLFPKVVRRKIGTGMMVFDFVSQCEYNLKITDYVTEEVLFVSDDVIENYEMIRDSELGKRMVAFVTAEGDYIVIRALSETCM